MIDRRKLKRVQNRLRKHCGMVGKFDRCIELHSDGIFISVKPFGLRAFVQEGDDRVFVSGLMLRKHGIRNVHLAIARAIHAMNEPEHLL